MEKEKFLSIKEVAELCGLNYRQVHYLLITGKLPGIKFGWVWMIKEEDIPEKLINVG